MKHIEINNNMKYLITIDIDGTLKRSDDTISERSKKVIQELINQGHVIAICSGRPRYFSSMIAKDALASRYLISSNGTEVYDIVNNKLIFSEYISKDVCKKIYDITKELNIRVVFSSGNIEYATQFIKNDSQILLNDNNLDELLKLNIKQVVVVVDNNEVLKQYANRISNIKEVYVVDRSNENDDFKFISVISSNVSKGNALKVLAEYLNIPMENTIAIGNDNNDISMIKIANVGVAVENASDDLKKCADVITKSNDLDGVACYLETLIK